MVQKITTYLKISFVFLQVLFTQIFSLIEFAFFNRRIESIQSAGRFLQGKLVKDMSSKNIIVKFIRLCLRIIVWVYEHISFIYRYNRSSIEKCRHIFYNPDGLKEIALFGISDIARIILIITKQTGIKITGIYDNVDGLKFSGHLVSHYVNLKGYQGKILISSTINIEEKMGKLKRLGIKEEDILSL